MRAVAFVFVACLSLFTARFVACEPGTESSDGPVYEDVLKNSVNRFLKWRNERDHPMRCNESGDKIKLDNIDLQWTVNQGSFKVELNNATWNSFCDYTVTGVRLKADRGDPKISFVLELIIPDVAIEKFTWSIKGKWDQEYLDAAGAFPILYKNMSATVQIDVKLTAENGDIFWRVAGTHIRTDDELIHNPVVHFQKLHKFPRELPFRRLLNDLKRSIASQLEVKLLTFCEELMHECPWQTIVLGRI